MVPLKIHEWIQFNLFLLQGVLLSGSWSCLPFPFLKRDVVNKSKHPIDPDKY